MTTRADLVAQLAEIEGMAREARERLPTALAAMRAAAPGWPPATLGGQGGDGTSRVEALVVSGGYASDAAVRDARDLERAVTGGKARMATLSECLRDALGSTRHAWDIAGRWSREAVQPPELPGDGPGPDQCHSCYRVDRHFEPVDPRHTGRQDSRVPLCRWCADLRADPGITPATAKMPPVEFPAWRHRNPGKRLTEQVVERLQRKARAPLGSRSPRSRRLGARRW